MNHPVSDAIVFFGATGDLAYKQIFPALQGLVRDEGLDVPIIGVAKAGWSLDQLKARAKDSLSSHGGLDSKAFAKLASLLRYVDGDYNDPSTYVRRLIWAFRIARACRICRQAAVSNAIRIRRPHRENRQVGRPLSEPPGF